MISELRTFIAVARHGTFTSAGGQIGLTQSAVSSQMKRLEEALGFALFDRTGRSASLNAAGTATLARAEELITLYARMGELPHAGESDAADDSLLRIGAIASVQSTLLCRALVQFRTRFPKLRVHVVPGVSLHLLDQLDTEEIDAAIMIRPPFGMLPELVWEPLLREPFALLVPATVKGRDWRILLQSQPFLRYERTSFGGRLVERFLRSSHITVQESIELDDLDGMVRMVANGLGVALIPMGEAAHALPAQVRKLSLGRQGFDREIGIVQRRRRASHPAVSELAQCLRDAAGMAIRPP